MWLFFKYRLHDLGHLNSGKGIYYLPEKLHSLKKFPVSKIPKEVRQILGLTGYYWKFIPTYASLVWPWCN